MRVLLGYKAESIYDVQLPTYASYKVDGWRGLWQGMEFFSRTGKTIPNRALQAIAKQVGLPAGWDGEIVIGDPAAPDVFSKTDKFCKKMSAGIPAEGVRFYTFDNVSAAGGFEQRKSTLCDIPPFVTVLNQIPILTYEELEQFENYAVARGYEGIVCRKPTGAYKQGRSTKNENYLVKIKRYIDGEFQIIGFVEKQHNANPAFVNEVGYTKRSSHREGKVPAGTLGSIVVNWNGHELHVGTGWDAAEARWIWEHRDQLLGEFATIKYSPVIKDLPRQPVWKSLRSKIEL